MLNLMGFSYLAVSVQSLQIHHKDLYHKQSDISEFTLIAMGNPIFKAPYPYFSGRSNMNLQ